MGRDERAKAVERQSRLLQEFARSVSTGAIGAVDRFGRRIEVGQHVLFHAPVDYVYKVIDVAPVLAPNAPPGLLRVVMEATITASVHVNMPEISMIVIGAGAGAEAPAPVEPLAAEATTPTAEVQDGPTVD